ncbi:sigma-70 family RNA polymerase sigma factor [Anoxybacillus geothermalis]|nr:sigma-70 family RNA polymerase sigma factor [Anoxybacillus geothermalis]WJQ15367.1 sigma-70 family RNA polymerase sigma factor [Geobacillus stearothermophilus]
MEWEEKIIEDDDFDINEFLVTVGIQETDPKYNGNIELLRQLHDCSTDKEGLLEELIEKNMGLVRKMAMYYSKYVNHKLSEEDLIAEGTLGLIKAIHRFDIKSNTRLSTYAIWWIRQTILRAIINDGFTVRVPVHTFEKIRKVFAKENESYKLFRKINIDWICRELDMSKEKYYELKAIDKRYLHMASLHSPVEDGEEELIDFISNHVEHAYESYNKELEDPLELASRSEVREKIFASLDRLTERERHVIIERFGLEDDHNKTLEEVGRKMGITRERVRQIEEKALNKLKKYLRGFEDY